jgi:heme/copper-type cytochrome/quinol oxidase subunit 4
MMLVPLLRARSTAVWSVLVALTIVSWQVGTHGSNRDVATTLVLAVAFIKVRFVGLYFMELRDAPLPLRLIFEGYCLVVGTAVVVMSLAL